MTFAPVKTSPYLKPFRFIRFDEGPLWPPRVWLLLVDYAFDSTAILRIKTAANAALPERYRR